MAGPRFVLAIDQGTTSSRAMLFDRHGAPAAGANAEFRQFYPRNGWVEHDATEIWQSTLSVCRRAMSDANAAPRDIAAIGVTNQRETTVIWDRATGEPIHRAIVWQDRRTADFCTELKAAGYEELVQSKTGLLIDPYFSGTKIRWLLDNVPDARTRAERGELAFGTIDAWLLWKLTGGNVHMTDVTNACRTLLLNIETRRWDTELLDLFGVPEGILPEVGDSRMMFGLSDSDLLGGAIPVAGIAGDQQAATVGQACFEDGMLKSTYGTGCFAVMNTGARLVPSANRLLTTVAYQLDGHPTYALEGSIFMAGATIQWLRDGLRLFDNVAKSEALAREADPDSSVYLVPAFTGLGAPYWDPHARGAIFGLTRDTGPAEIARAALESLAYQTRDLIVAMHEDMDAAGAPPPSTLRIDGGLVVNDWAVQALSDILQLPVERPKVTETTALGAAYLAGLGTGFYESLEAIAMHWQCERRFEPAMSLDEAEARYAGWREAVGRVLTDGP